MIQVRNIIKKCIRPLYRELREVVYLLSGKPRGVGYIMMMHHVLPEGAKGMPDERYLNIQPDNLDKFLTEAAREYDFIPLSEVPDRIRNPRDRKFMALTLDDGCQSVYANGYPIFKKHNAPFTIFVTTGFVGGMCDNSEIQDEKEPAMTWEQLKELNADPLVSIGGHTVTHPKLGLLPVDEMKHEIEDCIKSVKNNMNLEITTFAYPFGSESDDVHKVMSDDANQITIAVLATLGAISTADTDLYRLHRINLSDQETVNELCHWRDVYMGL